MTMYAIRDREAGNMIDIFYTRKEAEKAIERETLLGELSATLADSDAAICELYETTLAQSGTIAEQDAAICELYEMIMEV